MDDELQRPYYNEVTGETLMLTDKEFGELPPDSGIRRIHPGEVVPPPTGLAPPAEVPEEE